MTKPNPRRRLVRPWRRRLWLGIFAAVCFLMLYGWRQFLPLSPHSHEYFYIRVAPGESASQIGTTLEHQKIIRSALAFDLASRAAHLSRTLKSGVYRLSPSNSLNTILRIMKSGDVVVIKVTIPEGFTVRQVVSRLVAAHIGTTTQYQKLEQRPLSGMPAPMPGVRDPLEGFLFPATYSFPWGITAKEALQTMWQTFRTEALPLYLRVHSHLSMIQWVTLASIVQQENKRAAEAPDIAAVFLNRIAIKMPLQSDATVRYAIGHPIDGSLSYQNLQVASPYNTYLNSGLPPGPIANPGLTALSAALHPAPVGYLYFLTLPNGQVLFATTYQQHLANIAYANAHY